MATYVDSVFLGEGTFGRVTKVIRKPDGKVLACKTIRFTKDPRGKEAVELEYTVLSRLQHPNIVQYEAIQWLPREAKLYMEYCDGTNLEEYMWAKSRFVSARYLGVNNSRVRSESDWPSEQDAWRLFFQLASALAYCHNGVVRKSTGGFYVDAFPGPWQTILHRDIKPRNVRKNDGQVTAKLGDFGLGVILFEGVVQPSYAGTNQYIPPEITRSSPLWSTKCDIFSFGCTMYCFCMGNPPFEAHLTNNEPYTALADRFSENLRDWISQCISYHADDRPEAVTMFETASTMVDERELVNVSLVTATSRPQSAPPSSTIQTGVLSPAPVVRPLQSSYQFDQNISPSQSDSNLVVNGVDIPSPASTIRPSSQSPLDTHQTQLPLNPTSVPLTQQQAEQIKTARKPVIHLLAVRSMTERSLRDKVPGISKDNLRQVLEDVGELGISTGKWKLRKSFYKELDVWTYDYSSVEDRQRAINNAIRKYDKMKLGVGEPEWDRLLARAERGTGRHLSKLQVPNAQGPAALLESSSTMPSDSEYSSQQSLSILQPRHTSRRNRRHKQQHQSTLADVHDDPIQELDESPAILGTRTPAGSAPVHRRRILGQIAERPKAGDIRASEGQLQDIGNLSHKSSDRGRWGESDMAEAMNNDRWSESWYEPPVSAPSLTYEHKLQQAIEYQNDIDGSTVTLTAEDLRNSRREQRRASGSRSAESIRSPDESDSNNDGTVIIKVTGQARVMVAGTQINCIDGGEIEIKKQNLRVRSEELDEE